MEATEKVKKPARAKSKVARKVTGKVAIGTFKLPKSIVKGLQKAAKAQGFATFGIYAAG